MFHHFSSNRKIYEKCKMGVGTFIFSIWGRFSIAIKKQTMHRYVNIFKTHCVSDDLLITSDTKVMLRQKVYGPRKKARMKIAECTKC